MSADLTPTPSSVTGPSYFVLHRPRYYASTSEPLPPLSNPSPGHFPSLGHVDGPEVRVTSSNAPKSLPSTFRLPPTTGRLPTLENEGLSQRHRHSSTPSGPSSRQPSVPSQRHSNTPSRGKSRRSSDSKRTRALKLPFKLPAPFAKPDKDRAKSESGNESDLSQSRQGSGLGSYKKTRKDRSSSGISPRVTEKDGPRTKLPKGLSIEPLPPPIQRQLTHSVGYGRKITIETDFEDSIPTPPPKPEEPEVDSSEPRLRKGLFAKSKKYLKSLNTTKQTLKACPNVPPEERSHNNTIETLERSSSLIRPMADRKSSVTTTSDSSRDTRGSHRFFALPSWKHHRSISNTSSLRDLKRSVPPSSTPDGSTAYLGGDNKRHFKPDISNLRMPNFLPSEAQRLGTPAGSGEQEDWTFHKKGFFFDYDSLPEPPREEADAGSTANEKRKEPTEDVFNPKKCRRMERKHSETGWYSLQMELVEKQAEEEKRHAEIEEFEPPEHLPSSPLCPRNPKHKSKGKGTCVMHRRNPGGSDAG